MTSPTNAEEAAALAGLPVSRETAERLTLYVDLLRRWNPSKNLVAASTLDGVWSRHIADSLQVLRCAPTAKVWVDLGSGGGLPALVVAAMLAERPGAMVHCVESKLGKAAFLQEAGRQMRVPVKVWPKRIEDVVGREIVSADVVSARPGATRRSPVAGQSLVENWCGRSLSQGPRCRGRIDPGR